MREVIRQQTDAFMKKVWDNHKALQEEIPCEVKLTFQFVDSKQALTQYKILKYDGADDEDDDYDFI